MTKSTIKVIVFAITFLAGIAFCIGGIWEPALLVIGGALITGATGMFAQSCMQGGNTSQPATREPEPDIEMQHINTHEHKKTLKYSKHISGKDSDGNHFTEDFTITKEEDSPTSSDEYKTAEGESEESNSNHLRLV